MRGTDRLGACWGSHSRSHFYPPHPFPKAAWASLQYGSKDLTGTVPSGKC